MDQAQRVALVTCRDLPHLDDDDAGLLPALAALGLRGYVAFWDDPSAQWDSFDLVVPRSTWDFAWRREEFVDWARHVGETGRMANPVEAIQWNTDKHYLAALAREGVPVVPTDWLEPDAELSSRKLHTRFPALGDFVIKPAVSAGSVDTGRYSAASPRARGLAIHHAHRLLDAGRTVMLQRYVTSVDVLGETGLVFIDGQFAWAVGREAMLHGPAAGIPGVYRHGTVHETEASPDQIEVGRLALAAAMKAVGVPSSWPPLQARVDVVSADAGPAVLELELTHPDLFLGLVPGRAERFAEAIAARVGRV
jgi:hypothetical protein